METNKKQIIKRAGIITLLLILVIIVGFIMVRYEIEGEKNLPFNLSKIMIISTADGLNKNDESIIINQCNDFYLTFEKNAEINDKNMIKKIYIENIKVLSEPVKGTVKFYKPCKEGKLVYENSEEYQIKDSIIYYGDEKTDLHTLKVSNQGGTISFRTSVESIGEIPVDKESTSKTVSYNNDGTLLKKAEISISEIRYNMSFDIIIELTDGKMYKANINQSLPIEDEREGGINAIEKIDMQDVVFKRIKKGINLFLKV